MNRKSPIGLLLAGVAWRTIGTASAGETLARQLATTDEQNRMLAGMSLVRAGERSVKLIARKIENGEATPELVRLLTDFESALAHDLLLKLESDPASPLSGVARECLEQLDRMAQL